MATKAKKKAAQKKTKKVFEATGSIVTTKGKVVPSAKKTRTFIPEGGVCKTC